MKRALAGTTIVFLLLVVALASAGCTKEKPAGRAQDAAAMAGSAITSTLVLTAPTDPIGGYVLPTLTPTVRVTIVAVPGTATTTAGFEELIATEAPPTATPQPPTPAPLTVDAPGTAPPEASPVGTPVPVLTPQPQPVTPAPVTTQFPVAPPSTAIPPAPEPTPNPGATYVVRWGDTLSSIAAQFGVTVDAIKSANGMANDIIVVGQQLVIPGVAAPAPGAGQSVTHIVQPGETLFRIALRYNVTVEAITEANGISNPWFIYVGQQLTIPVAPGGSAPPASGGTYVVQPGDTLYAIAVRFNTTVEALMVANNLTNPNMISQGQVLALP